MLNTQVGLQSWPRSSAFWVVSDLAILFDSQKIKNIETFYIQRIYLLLIESSLCSSLDPLFHSDSIIYHKSSQCKRNECISILLSKWNRSNRICIIPHHLFYWILRSLFTHNMIKSDHRKDSLQVNQPILCMGLTRWLEQRHIYLVVNSNKCGR